MKFGGTSVASAAAMERVIHIIRNNLQIQLVVVVSAIAGMTKDLVKLYDAAVQNDSIDCRNLLAYIISNHLTIAKEIINDELLYQEAAKLIVQYENQMFVIITELFQGRNLQKSYPALLAYGELLSSSIIYYAMLDRDIRVKLTDVRDLIITDDNYVNAKPLLDIISRTVPLALKQEITEGYTIITQGFIAANQEKDTTILGFEGSDYTASLIGMAMDAEEIQIWTDVDGIMTSDPKDIPTARLIPSLSFEEAEELSCFGAKIIHPSTVAPAAQKNIPIRILNSLNIDINQSGTVIYQNSTPETAAIAFKENITLLKIKKFSLVDEILFQNQVSHWVQSLNTISPHIIQMSPEIILVTFPKAVFPVNHSVCLNNNDIASYEYFDGISMICLLGKLWNSPEKVIHTLGDNLKVEMLFRSITSLSLILIVAKDQLQPIIRRLHEVMVR